MKRLCVYLVCLSLLGGCGSRGGKAGAGDGYVVGESGLMPPYRVELERAIGNPVAVGLSEIGGEITYLPLETSQRSLIGRIGKTIFNDSLIFVQSSFDRLMAFDRSGNFVRSYGNVGRGPGEFVQISDFAISPDNSKMYVNAEYDLLAYDIGGRFLKSSKLYDVGKIAFYNDSLLIVGLANIFPLGPNIVGVNTDISVYFTDLEGNMGKSYDYHHPMLTALGMPVTSLYRSGGEVRFLELIADTLYTVTPEALIPYASFDLGPEKIPTEFFTTRRFLPEFFAQLERYSDNYMLLAVTEDRNRIYMNIGQGNLDSNYEVFGIFDKRTGKRKVMGGDGFTNDIDGGLPFVPKYVLGDDVLVGWVDAYKLKEHVEALDAEEMTGLYGERFERLAELAAGLEEDDNPVLVMVK